MRALLLALALFANPASRTEALRPVRAGPPSAPPLPLSAAARDVAALGAQHTYGPVAVACGAAEFLASQSPDAFALDRQSARVAARAASPNSRCGNQVFKMHVLGAQQRAFLSGELRGGSPPRSRRRASSSSPAAPRRT